jgi:hypothetical protein
MKAGHVKPNRRTILRWIFLAVGGGAVGVFTQRGECARDARCTGCPLLTDCALPPAQEKKNGHR